jgi:TetR/AcrR family transcriptional repressor of nem operon
MRKSKLETAETRKRIVEAASAQFRENGIAETGLADLMGAAGLTHGGFYKHFESKEQVVVESVELATQSMMRATEAILAAAPPGKEIQAFLADYLSTDHQNHPARACPFATLSCDAARSSDAVRTAFTRGFQNLVETIARQFKDLSPAAAKKEALVTLSTMIGALTISRFVNDPDLSTAVLREAKKHLTP